jgi:hypothetical protein
MQVYLKKLSNKYPDAENFILDSMVTWHMSSRQHTGDLIVGIVVIKQGCYSFRGLLD